MSLAWLRDDDVGVREPEPGELEAMRADEWEFRLDNDLVDDGAWDAYCTARAESWIEDQVMDMSPAARAAILTDLDRPPVAEPAAARRRPPSAARVLRGGLAQYELTPPEAKFYDALVETGLTFTVQPWMQHVDRAFRPDFFIHYGGQVHAVEIDGHDFHKTKEQRGKDAAKTRWLAARDIRVIPFTASQVWRNPAGCVRELFDVLRRSQARP